MESMIELSTRILGPGIRRSLIGEPSQSKIEAAKKPKSLAITLAKMKGAGLIPNGIPNLDQVPTEVQIAASAILETLLSAVDDRRAAFSDVADLGSAYKLVSSGFSEPTSAIEEKSFLGLQEKVNMAYLYAGAEEVATATDFAESQARLVQATKSYGVKIETTWGVIDLSGGGNSVHDGVPTLLTIDTGGDDVYINSPCNSSASNWASISIDTSGNDNYVSDQTLLKIQVADWPSRGKAQSLSGPGSALFGVTFLVDSTGDDHYRSTRSSLGSATFGLAYLKDKEGKDEYDCYTNSLGFGHYGIGILEDLKGDDIYKGFSQHSGVGLPQGFGLILDKSGSDTYDSNDKVLDFPSAQSAEHNNSMAIGAGYGFRADYTTGHSQSGGVGIVYDLEGNDKYSCGVFGMGAGYWEGVGMLWDDAGVDQYAGQWYVEGASAHFGIGAIFEKSGDDRYLAGMNMALGAGHDFGIGFVCDSAGNDEYIAPNLSLGAGNANGIGIFVELAGDDSYKSSGTSLGQATEAQKSSLRERALCFGLFLDNGGRDSFPESFAYAKNNNRSANWATKNSRSAESQMGVFVDR